MGFRASHTLNIIQKNQKVQEILFIFFYTLFKLSDLAPQILDFTLINVNPFGLGFIILSPLVPKFGNYNAYRNHQNTE